MEGEGRSNAWWLFRKTKLGIDHLTDLTNKWETNRRK